MAALQNVNGSRLQDTAGNQIERQALTRRIAIFIEDLVDTGLHPIVEAAGLADRATKGVLYHTVEAIAGLLPTPRNLHHIMEATRLVDLAANIASPERQPRPREPVGEMLVGPLARKVGIRMQLDEADDCGSERSWEM
ncbi:MAG: hypothetical protein Q9213_006946 [Squamulea squamosa]